MNKQQILSQIENHLRFQHYDDAILLCESRKYLSCLLDDLKSMRDKYNSIKCILKSFILNEGNYFSSVETYLACLKHEHMNLIDRLKELGV